MATSDRDVEVELAQPDPDVHCAAGWVPYRMVLAVDRRAVPSLEDVQRASLEGGVVSFYPATLP